MDILACSSGGPLKFGEHECACGNRHGTELLGGFENKTKKWKDYLANKCVSDISKNPKEEKHNQKHNQNEGKE